MKRPRDTGSESSMAPASPLEEVKHNIDCNTNTTTTTKSNTNTVALEEIRAKLEQARMKKTAAEERLLRQKQQDSVPSTPSATKSPSPTPAKTPATATMAIQSQTTDDTGTPKPMATIQTRDAIATPKSINITRAQEAQVALDRARFKLQGALQNRDRALLQQRKSLTSSNPLDAALATPGNNNNNNNTGVSSWNRKRRSPQQQYFPRQKQGRYNSNNSGIAAHGGLPPISALSQSFSLRINDISLTGPSNMVYYCNDPNMDYSPASCMGAQGGKEAIEALRRGLYWPFKGGEGKTAAATTSNKNHNATSISLVQRKLQLQNELMALKEKLDMKSSQEPKQQTTTNATTATAAAAKANGRNGKTATKEGLERRKAEAQTVMDISYWKHFVSKQEHLLEQVTAKINNMNDTNTSNSSHHHRRPPKIPRGAASTYKECLHERHATNKAIAKVQHDLDIIEKRQRVVEEGIVVSTQTLLEARQALHDERKTASKKLAVPKKTETQSISSTTRTTAMTFAEVAKRKLVPEKNETPLISSSTKTTAMTVEATKRKFDPDPQDQAITTMKSQKYCTQSREILEYFAGKQAAAATVNSHREDSAISVEKNGIKPNRTEKLDEICDETRPKDGTRDPPGRYKN